MRLNGEEVRRRATDRGLTISELLDESDREERRVQRKLALAQRVANRNPDASFENIWHTLVLLEASPLERLNAALRRGRPRTLQRA